MNSSFFQRFFGTLCCLLLVAVACSAQQEISIGELLEEAKIDADSLIKEVNSAAEKESEKEAVKEAEPETASTPRPRLFRPKQNRPAFQKNLKPLLGSI
jgi:hypothetical protein